MSTSDLPLLPSLDPITPTSDLDASVQTALAAPAGVQAVTPAPEQPLGRSWDFDWQLGEFRRIGQSAAEVVGFDAVAQWALMAIHTTRYANPVYSDEFGTERPDRLVGELVTASVIADWQAAIVEALLVHDRITAIENVSLDWDPVTGVLTVISLDIVTDADQVVTVSDITMQAGGQ